MSDEDLLKMPVKRFWLLSANVDRIEAQRGLRTLTIANASQGDATACRDSMIGEVGTIATGTAQLDRSGLEALKQLR